MTAKTAILEVLSKAPEPLAVHQFPYIGFSQTGISARLRELARDGKVESVPVPNKRYTAWRVASGELPIYIQTAPMAGEGR
jgi:hypothetical protein